MNSSSPASPLEYDWPQIDENSPLGLCYTSGTTGNPKGVEYEHRSQYLHTITISMTDSIALSARGQRVRRSCPCFMPWAGECPGRP